MRNDFLIEFDMESHYKDSLSTAVVNILLQCGFENSSKRALDELVGMSINYMKNITSKISNLTNECNLPESDILIGLGALAMHGHKLDDLFSFMNNYNEIFPPAPKTYFGPVPLKSVETKTREEKPAEIVAWAPDMSPSLATIGMKLKNKQIVTDPNFDRSNCLALSMNSPLSKNSDKTGGLKMFSNGSTSVKSQKYGSNCSYDLPPEAFPNKYEPPTIDVDCNGAVIGLNGKIGKLPDPFISDIEEQDLMRQKSKFTAQFNGVRHKQFARLHDERQMKRRSSSISSSGRNVGSESGGVNQDEMKENVAKSCSSNHLSPMVGFMSETGYKCVQQQPFEPSRNTISDDAWNAALQARIEPLVKPELSSSHFPNNHHYLVSDEHSLSPPPAHSQLAASKRSKKHKRTSSSMSHSSRPKKTRKVEVEGKIVESAGHIYQNESTMDSFASERSVPYSSLSEREPIYNHYDSYRQTSNHMADKSPSYSPANNFVPNSIHYQSEILSTQPVSQTSAKSFKSKKKSRKTHFTNKRKKKPLYYPTSASNNMAATGGGGSSTQPFYPNNHHYNLPTASSHQLDRHHHPPFRASDAYDRHSMTPSPRGAMDTYFDESDDDRTEPMQESSEEMIRMLEMTDESSMRQKPINPLPLAPAVQQFNQTVAHNDEHATPSHGAIRMKFKIKKNKNSVTRGPSSIVNSNTDLSSPVQSPQHSDDKNSISERLQLMHYTSPLSELEPGPYGKSPADRPYYHMYHQQPSPAYSSTHESFRDCYRLDGSVASGGNDLSPINDKPTPTPTPTPKQHNPIKSNFNINRFNSSSTHSSPKTIPASDDCDKIPTLLFKTTKSVKKRKRSRLSSGSKKVKSKKSIKLKINHDQMIPTKPIEKHFVSVEDVFSDEDDNNKIDQNNHHNYHHQSRQFNEPIVTSHVASPPSHARPMQQLPVITDKSPYRTPIPPIKISSSKSTVKKSKTKSKPIVMNTTPSKIEQKHVYNYCCLQGEAFYKSEDGKTVYTCPICNTEDNGSLMLGCDRCEDWYHGLCLGIFIPPPEDQDWFCPRCNEDKLSESLNNFNATKSKSKSRTKKK